MTNFIRANTSVGIIGCGWLGLALAKSLISKKYSVMVTKQNEDGVALLNTLGLNTVQFCLPIDHSSLKGNPIFTQSTIVICIPPKFKQGKRDYPANIKTIVQAAEEAAVQRIILVSTTGIYNGLNGEVSESNSLNMDEDKVAILNEAEQCVLSFSREKSILRLSGLVGPERHPGRFFKAGRSISSPNAPLNLIHQYDAVGLLECLLSKKAPMGIYNGVSQTKGTKASFYHLAATIIGLEPPFFNEANMEVDNRKVIGDKAKKLLGYQFIYDDLNDWLYTDKR